MLAEDTQAPKTVLVMEPGHKFQIRIPSRNIYRAESLPILKKQTNQPQQLMPMVSNAE